MESAKAGAVAGEGKAVTSERFRCEAKLAARQNALKRETEKTFSVERNGNASGPS
jgi:hypothetical protein